MQRRDLLVGSALGLVSLTFSRLAAAWEEIDVAQGVRVFRRDVAGSPLVAFKGMGYVNAPIAKLCWVLADNQHRTDWVDRLKKTTVLERQSDFDFILYQHFGLPVLLSDRDYVYRAKGSRDAKTGIVTLRMHSVKHPKAPPTVGVRAQLVGSSYTLIPKGKQTLVIVEIQTDPKGALPAWLVNLIQKSWPSNTILALRRQVKKSFVKELEIK